MSIPIFIVNCIRIPRRAFYMVSFDQNDQLFGRIKDLPEEMRKWNTSQRAWEVSTMGLLRVIKIYRNSNKIQFDFGSIDGRNLFIKQIKKIEEAEFERERKLNELRENKEKWLNYKIELENNFEQYSELVHSFVLDGIKLYPHQIVASLFLNKTRSALLSHEMGLGKSLSSILFVEMNRDFEKVVVITPNSLKYNYYNEVEKFTNSKAHIVGKKKNKYSIEDAKYIILNYEYFNSAKNSVLKWKKLKIGKINSLIFDECQQLKNTSTNTYKNIKHIFGKEIFNNEEESRIFMSGTPAPNRAHELFSILNFISPIDFATKKYFNEYYCGMTYDFYNGWGWVNGSAESKLEELYHKIAPFTHRVKKEDALKDLPDKTYQKLMMELSEQNLKLYEEVEKGVVNEFLLNPTSNPLTIMLRLRQFTSAMKYEQIIELIDAVLESGEKIVIVDMFKESLKKLKEKYGELACLHTGDVTDLEVRAEMVKDFQDPNGKCKVFLGSIQTCNYGLTLTAASKLIILTLPFSVGQYDQVADRLHRIGQKDAVNIYVPAFIETIDEYVYGSIESKRKELVKVMDNVDYESDITESVVKEVMDMIKNKYK